MSINEMFAESTTNRHARLTGSAQLTQLADTTATSIIRLMEESIDEYRERIAVSFKDNDVLDSLVTELTDTTELIEQAAFLTEISEETVNGILKSQQSKRSRLKSKDATLDNYRSIVSAAIAEHIIRLVFDKPKQHGAGHRHAAHSIDYTPAELEEFANNPEALRRAIRNVQSKKSIYKKREDFDESDEYWMQILKVEQQLKDLRGDASVTIVEVDRTKDALAELLSDVDLDSLESAEGKDLLKKLAELAATE